jgi:translation initiation factor 1 (eIF-1/SUI1)
MLKHVIVGLACLATSLGAQARPTPKGVPRVSYAVVESRGSIRVVVISPKDKTETRLRELGTELKADFALTPIILVNVFDSDRAAKMFDRVLAAGGSLSNAEDRYYDAHQVAIYNRNRNTGHEQYSMFPNGASGKQIDGVP